MPSSSGYDAFGQPNTDVRRASRCNLGAMESVVEGDKVPTVARGSGKGTGEAQRRLSRCYVAAASAHDLAALAPIFRRVELLTVTDLPAVPRTASEAVRAAIETADVVIGLLTGEPSDLNVVTELGMATALGKPAVVLTAGESRLPAALADALHVRVSSLGSPDSLDDLGEVLELVARTQRPRHQGPSSRASRPAGAAADRLIAAFEDRSVSESAIIDLLVEAFTAAGARARRTTLPGDHGFDLAVSSPDLLGFAASPLFVELKLHVSSASTIRATAEGLSRELERRGGGWALLLYEPNPDVILPESIAADLPVLTARLKPFAEALRKRSFAEIVRELRNERAHAAASS